MSQKTKDGFEILLQKNNKISQIKKQRWPISGTTIQNGTRFVESVENTGHY